MALTQETILTFLLENGGKVKNSVLLNNFKPQINCSDPAEKKHNRDLFKRFVNSVAVVKQVDDVKFVVVKKRYQDLMRGEDNFNAQKSDVDARFSNTSFSPTCSERSASVRDESKMLHSDIENNNRSASTSNIIDGDCLNGNVHISDQEGCLTDGAVSCNIKPINDDEPHTVVKVLNVSSDKIKTGAVFAIVAVRPPPESPRELVLARRDELNPASNVPGPKTPMKSNALTQRALPPSERGLRPRDPGGVSARHVRTSPWEHEQQELQPRSPPPRRPPAKTCRPGEDSGFSESVPLDPLAHEWLVKSAAGLWGQVYGLLLQDVRLAQRRDFMSGFTALHWAAKAGHGQMVRSIVDVSGRSGVRLDVNARTYGGYTPLHLAAMHGHAPVAALLVRDYGADASVRDNGGKRPHHYLGSGAGAELREVLGAPRGASQDRGQTQEDEEEDEEDRELHKGLTTLTRLFQPHTGHRKKPRQQRPSATATGEHD